MSCIRRSFSASPSLYLSLQSGIEAGAKLELCHFTVCTNWWCRLAICEYMLHKCAATCWILLNAPNPALSRGWAIHFAFAAHHLWASYTYRYACMCPPFICVSCVALTSWVNSRRQPPHSLQRAACCTLCSGTPLASSHATFSTFNFESWFHCYL